MIPVPNLDFHCKCTKQLIIFVLLVLINLLQGQCTCTVEKSVLNFEDVESDEALNRQLSSFTETLSTGRPSVGKYCSDINSKMLKGERDHRNYKQCEYGTCENLEMSKKNGKRSSHKVSHDGMLRSVRDVDTLLKYQQDSLGLFTTEVPFQLHYSPELQKTPLDSSFVNIDGWHPKNGSLSPVLAAPVATHFPRVYGRFQQTRRRNILGDIKNAFRPKDSLQNNSDYMSFMVPLQQLVNPDDAFIIDRNGVIHKGRMHYRQFVHPVLKVLARKDQRHTTAGPRLSKPAKRDESSTTAQPTQSSSEANKPTEAADKSQEKSKSNETSEFEVKSSGSHQYQVMPVNSGNQTGNATSGEEAAKKNMLKQIIAELEQFKSHSSAGGSVVTVDNTPCSIFGSWISDAGGVRFDISFLNESNSLNVSIAPTIPPKKEAWFNETEWNITGEIPFTEKGVFTLTAVHKTQRKMALFAGQCMMCMGEELVAGMWTTGRSARDCRDTIVAYSERPDVFRKEVLHILRAQKKNELASKANKTTAAMSTTEATKKVKRWWAD